MGRGRDDGTGIQTGVGVMEGTDRCPRDVRMAVRAFARAVKMVADLADLPSPDSLTEYHAKEYLDEMETLLIHQLLTAFPSTQDRETILSEVGLDYLIERTQYLEMDWEEE